MGKSLNFGETHKSRVKILLKAFEETKTKTEFEEKRWKVSDCTVTLYSNGKLVVQGNGEEKVKQWLLHELQGEKELLLGIDETGRGESTGPFVIGFVLGTNDELRELRDSKKTSDLKQKAGIVSGKSLAQGSVSINASYVDKLRGKGLTMDGIEVKVINAIGKLFKEFDSKIEVKVDGKKFKGAGEGIEFIVKGDDLVPVIGAASVKAKNERENSKDKRKRESWKTKENN